MKCTQCGCEKLKPIQLQSLIKVEYLEKSKLLKIYICRDCGHLEFFYDFNEKLAKEKKIIAKAKDKLALISKKQKPLLQQQEEIKETFERYKDELNAVEVESTSLDITIRQQQELKKQAEEIREKMKQVRGQWEKIDCKICNLQDEGKNIEKAKEMELDKVNKEYEVFEREVF